MDASSSIIGYLKHKKAETRGFLKYGYYKKLIIYILDLHKEYYVRKLFLKLCKRGYFIKSEFDKKVFKYKFNPIPEQPIKKEENNKFESITLDFD